MSKKYYNGDGREVTLTTLCRTEPEWAANNIRWLEKENREVKGLVGMMQRYAQHRVEIGGKWCHDSPCKCGLDKLIAEAEAQGKGVDE